MTSQEATDSTKSINYIIKVILGIADGQNYNKRILFPDVNPRKSQKDVVTHRISSNRIC